MPAPRTGPLIGRLALRDFRNYRHAELEVPPRLTLVVGPNGAGKTNLLEALYFGCTGRSPRTSNERELLRRGTPVTRVVVETRDEDGLHRLEVGFAAGEPKRMRLDGSPAEGLAGLRARPLMSVFLPERLELVKGAPAARRAHLDQLVTALWPARANARGAYSRALAQRNALLARVRAGACGPGALDAWDVELAREGILLMEGRAAAVDGLHEPFAELADRLGLTDDAVLRYRPRSGAGDADGLTAELRERRTADLERGYTAHGPHRDELEIAVGGAPVRAYGSQGQQRLSVLALLFAERELLAAQRGRPPLMLLDDVMSELDSERRDLLAALLRSGGQAIVTATEPGHVPDVAGEELVRVRAGAIEAPVPA